MQEHDRSGMIGKKMCSLRAFLSRITNFSVRTLTLALHRNILNSDDGNGMCFDGHPRPFLARCILPLVRRSFRIWRKGLYYETRISCRGHCN